MKKVAVLVLAGLLAASAGAFAARSGFALGAEAASTNFSSWGGRFVAHFPSVPLHFGLGGYIGAGGFGLDLTADYWVNHGHLGSFFDYYIGLGGYLALNTTPFWFSLGARIPLGIQAWVLGNDLLEIFLEVAPAWVPVSSGGFSALAFEVQPALGFRIWF
jgi:hypothetical protein